MSVQVVLGMVVKPSRLEEGWIFGRAVRKSGRVMVRGASWAGVRGAVKVVRKWWRVLGVGLVVYLSRVGV